MINVASYWTLPPSLQGIVRGEVKEHEQQAMHDAVGYYCTEPIEGENEECFWYSVFCIKCYKMLKDKDGFIPVTTHQYCDPNHDMHGETCQTCDRALA